MIAFDSNVLIYVLEKNPEFVERAELVFLDIEKHGGICSSLTITESLHDNIQSLEQLAPLRSPMVMIVPLDTKIAETAGQLRIRYSLKTPDSIHIATALEKGAKILITNDQRLLKLRVPKLEIRPL